MPVLDNPRHERFAQELAKGKSADEAYSLAGYDANRGNASRLKANESVNARVVELQSRAAKRVEVTVEGLIDEAEEIRQLAIASGQFAAALNAIKEKGILSGQRIDRKEQGAPGEFAGISNPRELEDAIAKRFGMAGQSVAPARDPDEQGSLPGKPH